MAPEERRTAKQPKKMKKLMALFGLSRAPLARHCRSCGTPYRPGATVCALCGLELVTD
jgi:hypothetical protein